MEGRNDIRELDTPDKGIGTMKNIPIVILNKDRLPPLIDLVNSLQKRNYNNIIIIDNESTYQPLLDWYKQTNVTVFMNDVPETRFDNSTLYTLVQLQHPLFADITKGYYVYTDSDVVPIDENPENFIENMIEVCAQFNLHKVGLGIKIDDLPQNGSWQTAKAIEIESKFLENRIPHEKFELYKAPVDTSFAVYAPNSPALWGDNSIRMGGNHMARHYPFYYDVQNLPADELHYITTLKPNRGPVVSMWVQEVLRNNGLLK